MTHAPPAETHQLFNDAVKLRLANRLDDAAGRALGLWAGGYRTPWLALLLGNVALDLGFYQDACNWHTEGWNLVAPNGRIKPEAEKYFQYIALPLAYSRLRLGLWDPFTFLLWELGRVNRSWHPAPNTRPWGGQPEKLLILSEGGFGDIFLYSRLFQKLDPLQRAASRLVMAPMFTPLRGLRNWDGVESVWSDDIFDWSSFKFSAALMSLLSFTGIRSPEDIPPAQEFHVKRTKSPARLGLCWAAEENGVQKRIRSIDNPADLEPLRRFQFVSLIPGKTLPYFAYDAGLDSWTKTARVIAGLDAVVSVDSAVLHLAGLLGVPAIGILPLCSDWKYLLNRTDCIWWPTVKLFRNQSPYSWRDVMERVATYLETL